MSATTVELNAGSGGAKELHDSLTTVNGGAAPAGAVAQVVKQAFGAAGEATLVSGADPMPVTGPITDAQLRASSVPTLLRAMGTDYWPGYSVPADSGEVALMRDPGGALVVRGAVTTDEGSYRCNFANSSLQVAIGTCTFTNGSRAVTGSGFTSVDLHKGDYTKLGADAESALMQIESVDSDTALTLVDPYTGTGGTGAAVRQVVKSSTGSGATITVASGQCTISAGTTASAISEIERDVDYIPITKQSRVSVSQRIVNQDIYIGSYDEGAVSPRYFAWFHLTGTTNTAIICESAFNPTTAPSAAETESTTVSYPNGGTSAAAATYRVEAQPDRVRFYIDGVLVAEHTKAIPRPMDALTSTVRVVNGATPPASSTSIVIDYDSCQNFNELQVGNASEAENVVASQPPMKEFAYSAAGVIAINTDLLVIDCSQLRAINIQCTSMGTTGVVTGAWSNNGTTWVNATLITSTGASASTLNASGLWYTPVFARYFRLRLTTATTAGTTTLAVNGCQFDRPIWVATQQVTPVTPTQTFTNSLATTNATSTKASAGTVWSIHASNINAAACYLKLYNKTSAPTVGTDVPVLTIPLPPGAVTQIDGGSNGIRFGTGIAWAVTTAAADSDTGAVAANEIKVAIAYT